MDGNMSSKEESCLEQVATISAEKDIAQYVAGGRKEGRMGGWGEEGKDRINVNKRRHAHNTQHTHTHTRARTHTTG